MVFQSHRMDGTEFETATCFPCAVFLVKFLLTNINVSLSKPCHEHHARISIFTRMKSVRRNPPSPTAPRVTRRHVRKAAAGISLTELLMSITLFSVTLAGAIGAITAIDKLTTGYVSEGEQREANHADFSNAYDRISQNQDPLPPLAEQAQFGLAFVEVPGP